MEVITLNCPDCAALIELSLSVDYVICRRCGAGYRVSRSENSVNLQRAGGIASHSYTELEAELERAIVELEEQIADAREQIEIVRSREKGAALQVGCASFGVFGGVIVVLALFVTLARAYFGGFFFYAALLAVVVLGIVRLRRKLLSKQQREKLAADRSELEEGLPTLEAARDRLIRLRQ
ncbi:MAG: hypothetical protein DMF61_06525 [Blastocatellia bacterium AA13]|nr:MAG: hypothetical protein DMF61_06525 [Blastocatellia bacterium AA13]